MRPGQRVIDVSEDVLRSWPLPDPAEGDKEDRGRVVIVAGSAEIPGAAVLAATAALRAGAGKVAIAAPGSIASREWNATVALKGAVTHIAVPGGTVWRHDRGNSGLATSGSGGFWPG